MSYVQTSLLTDEEVIALGEVHWWVFVHGSLLVAFGLFLFALGEGFWQALYPMAFVIGLGFLLVGGFSLIKAFIHYRYSELAVTNKRVIAKFGLIQRETIELLHKNVESLHVSQSIIGRLLNFGTIIINGTGGVSTPISGIVSPLEFRKQALLTIDSRSD